MIRHCWYSPALSSTRARRSASNSDSISSKSSTGSCPRSSRRKLASASFRASTKVRHCPLEALLPASRPSRSISRSSRCGPTTVNPWAISLGRLRSRASFMASTNPCSSASLPTLGLYTIWSPSPPPDSSSCRGAASSATALIVLARRCMMYAPDSTSSPSQNSSSSGCDLPSRTAFSSWFRWDITCWYFCNSLR